MAGRRKRKKAFEALTWVDLEEWAGSKIVTRGRSYNRQGRVKDLVRTADGKLIAWVKGSERYASLVYFEDGELESVCTCPYWADCKHAVATVLEYLDCLKRGVNVPKTGNSDPRLAMLKDDLPEDSWTVDEADPEEDRIDESLHDYLKKQKKDALIKIINDLAARYPSLVT